MYGAVASHWEFVDDRFSLSVRIPPNTRATIRLPGAVLEEVLESGRPVGLAEGIDSAFQVDDAVLVESGSGNYVFTYGAENLKAGEFE
jgi:alpha-L-rhamnosidase